MMEINYIENENKINISSINKFDGRVLIYGDGTLVYIGDIHVNNNLSWYIPDRNMGGFKLIEVAIENYDGTFYQGKKFSKDGYYAEFDTDKFIREKYFPDFNIKGTMIELGAGPPEWISVSKHFRDNGWRCICIDPNPKFVKMHQKLGNEIYQYACSYEDSKSSNFEVAKTGWWDDDKEGVSVSSLGTKNQSDEFKESVSVDNINVEVKKLNTLLTELNVDHIDFISVDTEGWELEVMRGFDLDKYKPSVVLLENFFNDISYTEYMNSFGYKLDYTIDYNYIYIKSEKSTVYHAQSGEDIDIEKYFPEGHIGGCIDIGATNGVDINNSLHFEESGWYCLCVEPNPNFYSQLDINRKNSVNVAISDHNEDGGTFNVVNLNGNNEEAISGLRLDERLIRDHSNLNMKITPISCDIRTLDYCIENYYKYSKIDFVSIDTEGTELDVLKGFDINKWQPKLFIIENNYNDKDIEDYMNEFGYVKDQRKSVNDFYIKKTIIPMDTFGNLIDKLSIVNLKIWKYEDIKRDSSVDAEIVDATRKTNILNSQRNDLIQEIDEMLIDASNGKINFQNYKQGETKSYGR